VVIGVMLGSTADANLIWTFQRYGDLSAFYTHPICIVLIVLTCLSLSVPVVSRIRKERMKTVNQG
jgi:TctA family transporter